MNTKFHIFHYIWSCNRGDYHDFSIFLLLPSRNNRSGYTASLLMNHRIGDIPDFRQPLPQPFQDGVGFIAAYPQ